MEKLTYSEKLKDPRWQKKRLEIFQRDNFTCQKCNDTGNTLHVHHKKYLNNAEPWDCPNELLITLCELCHSLAEDKKIDFDSMATFTCRNNESVFKVLKHPGKQIMIIGGSNNNYYPLLLSNEAISDLIKFLSD